MERFTAIDLTGFEIGTIPPIGHSVPMEIYFDDDLVESCRSEGRDISGGSGIDGYSLIIPVDEILNSSAMGMFRNVKVYPIIKLIENNSYAENVNMSKIGGYDVSQKVKDRRGTKSNTDRCRSLRKDDNNIEINVTDDNYKPNFKAYFRKIVEKKAHLKKCDQLLRRSVMIFHG